MTTATRPQYRTDFNDLDDEGFVASLPGWGGDVTLPTVGTPVSLFDGDGNTCIGVVAGVDFKTGLISLKPVWESWVDATQSSFPAVDLLDALRASVAQAKQQLTTSSMDPEGAEVA